MTALALEMEGWRRWTLLGAGGLHMLLSVIRVIWNVPPLDDGAQNDPAGLVLLVLAVALFLFSWKKKALFRWGAVCIGVVVAVMLAAWGVSRFRWLELLYPLSNPISSLLHGYPRAFYTILCAVTGALCAVWVVAESIHTTLARQKQEQSLRLRSQMAQESYGRALESINQTAALRHEWKNQVAVLHLLQQKGDLDGLGRYLEELDVQLDKLAPRQYTKHFTINTILQNAAARAGDLGVSFCAAAPVPAELSIPDNDLCSLLLNLLDNALEGASRVPPPQAREVECTIKVTQGYLAIKCENSYTGELALDEKGRLQTTKADRDSHGFGLAQMRSIAEKHGSILDISYTGDRFTVQTALKLR